MPFETGQSSYQHLREILKQNTSQVVVFAGAGLSRSAGIPTWSGLQNSLIKSAANDAGLISAEDLEKRTALISLAKSEGNPWKAMEYLENALGAASFRASIYEAMGGITNQPPDLYDSLWSLGITAFLTLNLDRFASRSFSKQFPGQRLREFDGLSVNQHADTFKAGTPFVANLHGNIDNSSSWVLTQPQFEHLQSLEGYKALLQTCFLSKTILFVGISADDIGATGHLEKLVDLGVAPGSHFWLTSRNDAQTHAWAERLGIRQILYRATDEHHEELNEFARDIRGYKPTEIEPLPVVPTTKKERNTHTPSPFEVEQMPANEIRLLLAREAARILQSNDPNKLETYKQFWKEYEEPIYRAWSVSLQPDRNNLFDYVVTESIAKGAFAYVYKATDPVGNVVAIKVLHGNIREEPEMIEAFRRGIAAMNILKDRNVAGMVPYIAAWEIPTCCVMELIDGPTLETAVESRYLDDWFAILSAAIGIAEILRSAHQLPERVLHRDVRPANIMLKDYYDDPSNPKIVVLDFDLSWHRDASGLSVDLAKKENGYHAPEQLDKNQKSATRNALVDSFGFGMTLYFLVGAVHPRPSQHTQADWQKLLKSNIFSRGCSEWKSVPRRVARVIDRATQDKQKDRWDLTRILGELKTLKECLYANKKLPSSIEHIAEEIMARCFENSDYKWDPDKLEGFAELISGFTVKLEVDEEDRCIVALIEWLHTGDKMFKNVAKFIENAGLKVSAELKSGGWRIDFENHTHSQCRVTATIFVSALHRLDDLQRAASKLATAIATLRFN